MARVRIICADFHGRIDLRKVQQRLGKVRSDLTAVPQPRFPSILNRIQDEAARAQAAKPEATLESQLMGQVGLAKGYLTERAEDLDEEAVVYLVSRGHDHRECSRLIKCLTVTWRQDSDAALERTANERRVEKQALTPSDSWFDFWDHDAQFAAESSLLRAVEWC